MSLNLFFDYEPDLIMKVCKICKKAKSFDCFSNDSGANYLRYECKQCANNNRNIIKSIKKFAPKPRADHRCPICLEDNKQWCLDHDHKHNNFRGWLCHKCNLGLGNFDDDPDRIQRALKYIEKHNENH